MTSTDATHTGPGEPPERWTGSLPDGWLSVHSDPMQGQLELNLDDENTPPPSLPSPTAPPQQPPVQSGPDGPAPHRATADLPRQQPEAAADSPPDTGAEPAGRRRHRPKGPRRTRRRPRPAGRHRPPADGTCPVVEGTRPVADRACPAVRAACPALPAACPAAHPAERVAVRVAVRVAARPARRVAVRIASRAAARARASSRVAPRVRRACRGAGPRAETGGPDAEPPRARPECGPLGAGSGSPQARPRSGPCPTLARRPLAGTPVRRLPRSRTRDTPAQHRPERRPRPCGRCPPQWNRAGRLATPIRTPVQMSRRTPTIIRTSPRPLKGEPEPAPGTRKRHPSATSKRTSAGTSAGTSAESSAGNHGATQGRAFCASGWAHCGNSSDCHAPGSTPTCSPRRERCWTRRQPAKDCPAPTRRLLSQARQAVVSRPCSTH